MNESTVGSDIFKCPSCGADMTFDPQSGNLSCALCDRKDDICTVNEEIEEYDFDADETNPSLNDWGIATETVNCGNCGGKVVVPAGQATSACAFCGLSKVTSTDELPGIRPASLIPFKIDANKANSLFYDWMKKASFCTFCAQEGIPRQWS